jgi:hypothetical protein
MNESSVVVEPGLQQALQQLSSVLIPGETLEAWAVQRRVFALMQRRVLVGATSGRLIIISRRVLGGFDLTDLRWQDLESVTLQVGLLAADLQVRVGRTADLALEGASATRLLHLHGLRKDQAQAVYRICQTQDQSWREKRRVRELEELRARSGGIQLPATVASDGAPNAVHRLQEAKQLLDARLISDAEYEAIKAKIVSST